MGVMGDCCVRSCDLLNGIPARFFCLALVLTQGLVIDYYLVTYQNVYSWTWLSFDALNVGIFITSFLICRRQLLLQTSTEEDVRPFTLGWFAWLVYSVSIVARMSIVFTTFSYRLDEHDFFGPNTLKTSIALAACVFIFLLMSHHDAPAGSERRAYINDLTGTVVFDVLDTVDILEVMFDKDSRDSFLPGLQETILGVAGLNIIIPTIPLVTLALTNFGHKKLPRRLVSLHKLIVVLVVNLPNLILRLILWHGFSVGISPFMLKNVILIAITSYEFYEHKSEKFYEQRSGETSEVDRKRGGTPSDRGTSNGTNEENGTKEEGGTKKDRGARDFGFSMQERFYEP